VHRCLAASLGLMPLPQDLQDRALMAEVRRARARRTRTAAARSAVLLLRADAMAARIGWRSGGASAPHLCSRATCGHARVRARSLFIALTCSCGHKCVCVPPCAGCAQAVDNMNVRHTNAQMAGRASTELHTIQFFRGCETLADARVVKVQANGLLVFVPKYGIEGPVFFGAKGSDEAGVSLNEAKQARPALSAVFYQMLLPCLCISLQTHEPRSSTAAVHYCSSFRALVFQLVMLAHCTTCARHRACLPQSCTL
jgi:S1 domain